MKHILFIKFYALGDIITTLNFLESIKNKKFKISILTSNEYKFIYKDIFKFSGQIYLAKITNNLLNTALRILSSTIWFSKFDECWLGHRSFLLALLILIVSRSKVIYFGEKKFFNLIIPIGFQKAKNHTDEYFRFYPDSPIDKKIFTYQFNQDEIKNINFESSIEYRYKLILSIGSGNALASGKNKMWPIENFIHLVNKLDFLIILLGSKDEIMIGNYLQENCKEGQIVNLIGKTKIEEIIPYFNSADIFLGHDSGLSWFSSITKTPTIVLHGPTDPDYYGPTNDWVYKLQSNSDCLNCYNFRDSTKSIMYKCKKNICLQDLSVDTVENKLMQVISEYK